MNRPASAGRGLWLGAATACAWIGWQAWVHRGHFVDDAFIGLRYARNLLAGRGLAFNPGEWVEGITNVGWILTLAGAAPLFGGEAALPTLAKGFGLLFLLGAVLLAARAHARLVPLGGPARPVELAAVPLLAATQPDLTYFALAGMETGLAALLLVLGLWCLQPERPRLLALAALGVALFTVRPETGPIVPAVLAFLALRAGLQRGTEARHGELARIGRSAALFALLWIAVTAARLGYYGAALPNTFVAKSSVPPNEWLGRLAGLVTGSEINVPPPYSSPLFLLVVLGALVVLARSLQPSAEPPGAVTTAWALPVAAAATGLLFGIYAPPDWTGMGRYFGPYVPLAAILFVRAIALATERTLGSRRAAAVALALAVALLAGFGLWRTGRHLSPAALEETPGFILASEDLVPAARWIDEHLPPDGVVACRRIGVLGYFGRRPVFDYAFGLTDPRVARAVRRHGEPFRSPAAPELARLWRTVRPDSLLEDLERLRPLDGSVEPDPGQAPLAGRAGDRFRVHGVEYEVVRAFPVGDTRWVLSRAVKRPGG